MKKKVWYTFCRCGCGTLIPKYRQDGGLRSYVHASHANKPRSEETRKRISEALTGRVFTEEWCDNISASKMGKPLSEAHKKSISEASKGRKVSKATRNKISKSNMGRTFSEESKRKMSESAIIRCRRNKQEDDEDE